ncbi:molybdopterin-guanine dinucleotide biosynthesis protein B [Macrococcus brunensis]|uniref:Molybdopterin-guanine dinucleotide biosynthesis protein B n=1 Tax=Macrococcus brunensis TaxID=198483 RepID=A0A4V3BDK5_9STAP|nr:molybdopterin-guanine dinucleotide biosynthesis protein B [Macrococcus brunensis]TDL98436.1 molybdopterin-guanine dinucleotide biosynthesis protein B [Macrococcus brunensis]ULG72102.1 molybdopterin-guanine dinucleotide biosynthesis protein B [Macrococcus brunensis]ULG74354.1 molybdopterin-guanine dinucleotide biosynthesis protein B [Macrococcus brunensis]
MVKILQVVGYKKSGKTTVVNQLILAAKAQGMTVSVIKHHGDKSGQEIDIPLKRDHITFMTSGADESIVEGYDYVHKLSKPKSLERIIAEDVTSSPDLILIEGYKEADYDKLVLLRDSADYELLELKNIICTIKTEDISLTDFSQFL